MNYRHIFHAGNFADVLKHSVLVGLIEALKQKQTAFCYIDTHAGRGRYDLHGEEARKTRITVTAVYPSKDVRDMVLSTGMERGAGLSYDRLEELVAELQRA